MPHVVVAAHKLSSWMVQNHRAVTLSLACALALVSALVGHGVALADPLGGGGSGR
jgi:hypothetical protein